MMDMFGGMRRIALLSALLAINRVCLGTVSTNVPLYHWSYDAIDKLISYRYVDSSLISTRPISRLQMAHYIRQAKERFEASGDRNDIIEAILARLSAEFEEELVILGVLDGSAAETFFKPVEDPYLRYLYADRPVDIANAQGDAFEKGSNVRLGFSSRGTLYNTAAVFLRPQFADAWSDGDGKFDVVEGYGKITVWNLEAEFGKDSMWWGPGRHGSMLMSTNAQPLPMIKLSNPTPVQLPWVLHVFGPVRTTWFLAELEHSRAVPNAKLTGIRFDCKPRPYVEFGVSRVIMFGGSGMPDVGVLDYLKMFAATTEQRRSNQLAGADVSWIWRMPDAIPLRSIKTYVDGAGEDEAGGIPSKWGYLAGIELTDVLRTARTDVRFEFANDHVAGSPNVFYAHNIYTSGYTYKDRVIGHPMGTDSRDFTVQITHYLSPDLILGLTYDRQQHDLSVSQRPIVDQFSVDVTLFKSTTWQLSAGYRFEAWKNSEMNDNHILQVGMIREF